MNQEKVLIVDDEQYQRLFLCEMTASLGYHSVIAERGSEALQKMQNESFDVLITDLQMPQMDGLQLLEQALALDPGISVIVATAHGTIETAVAAMKKGAEDYLLKPVEFDALEMILKRVSAKRKLVRENKRLATENEFLRRNIDIRYHLSNTLGKSEASRALLDSIKIQMQSRDPLLILGETGVGKKDIARMIHFNGPWASNDLIIFDCERVPEALQESHLFGEEEDASTARPGRPGLVEKAHLGTLIIDQIHRLSKRCQSRLARVLIDEKTQRVGGQRFHPVNLRTIATSTPKEYERMASSGELRQDLLDLFNENTLITPPMRERKEDIPLLLAATVKQTSQMLGKEITKIDPAVVERFKAYDFPGNHRELQAMVESAIIRSQSTTLELADFSFAAEGSKA